MLLLDQTEGLRIWDSSRFFTQGMIRVAGWAENSLAPFKTLNNTRNEQYV